MTATLTIDDRSAVAAAKPDTELRPDIQAMRALAVGAVLLYHLWPNRITGGYVGVDVFFAISGFLITSHLLREISQTGTVRVGRFWARRAKRLLPASLTVLLSVAVAVVVVVPEAWWEQFLSEIIASTLYVENWLLAKNSVDYLALENASSPVQHFWTLSVEEQFYIALPLILLMVLAISGKRRGVATRWLVTVLAVAVVASLAYSMWLTVTTPTVSYFSTLTRAWEFGAGALLAFVTVRAGARVNQIVTLAGIGMIVAACLAFTSSTAFPGYAAALPVVGTLLVLWAGRDSVVAKVGAWWPVATLGYISYAVYLWHWPLVVLLPYVTGHPLTTLEKVGIFVATLLLAWASTRFLEEPVRFSPKLLGGTRRPITVAAWCAAGMAAVVAFSLVNITALNAREDARAVFMTTVKEAPPTCFGAAAMDPARADECTDGDLGDVMVPTLAMAKADDDNREECWGMESPTRAMICTVAAPEGYDKRIVAIGDSHNNTLIGAYQRIGESQGWRVDVAGTAGCYLTTAEQAANSDSHRSFCLKWRAAVWEAMRADPPDAIIVTHSTGDNIVVPAPGETVESATVDGLVEAWSELPDVPIIAIRDNPGMTKETAGCVARFGLDADVECDRPREQALVFDGQKEAAARVPNARVVDLSDFYCTDESCSPVIGNVLVYRDSRHVTSTWVRTLTPYLERDIVTSLGW